ncbi:MAG TPA: hypothetical protein VEB43_09145 [Anaeromyxobacter sp.]|nr:hypothetical protein [Anaeromyxobacter sp.]
MNRLAPLLLAATFGAACAHSTGESRPEDRPAPPAPAAQAPAPEKRGAKERPQTSARSGEKAEKPVASGKAAAPKVAPAGGPADYFPLAVGNEWVYVDRSPALPENRRGVLRTVRILERTADGFYRDNERGNLRVDGPCVRDRDRRLLCQPFTAGASWTSVVSPTVIERYEIANPSETVETPAGKFERCVRVRAHNRVKASIDQVLEITYAPRVGPVLIETYVVVDGRVTPQVKAMLQSYKLNGGS